MKVEEIPRRSKNLGAWYARIVEAADLCDKRYPIKGMNVWRPYGYKAMLLTDKLIRDEMEETGHEEVFFPALVPQTFFKKESKHIKGFESSVYWVTQAGEEKLEEKILLRPTSETAMYPIFSLWIRSYKDLPLKTFQIVTVYRYETKQTRTFIRAREFHFFEAHTCHKNFEQAETQIREDTEIVSRFFKKLCIPYMLNKRPDWDKFPGAYYSIGVDAIMPDEKVLQLGSFHQYRDNFAKAYDLKFEDEAGNKKYCHQTTFGMSERIIGALILLHSDDQGLKFPSAVAPYQVVVVPIPFKHVETEVVNYSMSIKELLKEAGFRVFLDDSDETPGSKFYLWELKGVPVRIEVGPRDMKRGAVTISKRGFEGKEEVPLELIGEHVRNDLKQIDSQLTKSAQDIKTKFMFQARNLKDIKNRKGVFELPLCEKEECGVACEKELELNTLGIPISGEKRPINSEICPICGKPAKSWVRFGKLY
jgi:prolyl-tRNA synthetase